MFHRIQLERKALALAIIAAFAAHNAAAQNSAEPIALAAAPKSKTEETQTLDTVTVTGSVLPRAKGATPVFSTTAADARDIKLINTEDAIVNAPNLAVRKRYIGDRNALIAGRSFGNTQATRGLVLADGFLLSNFLGRFNAPRWNLVAPEELQSVSVMHGPFSAVLQGNSIGSTVLMTTREPQGPEGSVRSLAYREGFEQYGSKDNYDGNRASVFTGTKVGDFSFSVGLDRLKTDGHPMQYLIFTPPTATSTAGTAVTGAQFDRDEKGLPRMIVGSSSGAREDATQTQGKLRANWQILPDVKASVVYSRWRNAYERDNESFLRDAAGNTVWGGPVNVAGRSYNISNGAAGTATTIASSSPFALTQGLEVHNFTGLRLVSQHSSGWSEFLTLSKYDIDTDTAKTSVQSQNLAAAGGAGSVTFGKDTGWFALDARARYTSADKALEVELGGQRYLYRLLNETYNTPQWRDEANLGAITQRYAGKTLTDSLYVQSSYRVAPTLKLEAGLRNDDFLAYGGTQFIRGAAANATTTYAQRTAAYLSPKASATFNAPMDVELKASYGRGYRFPTVSELFQGSRSGTSLVTADANLQPERSDAIELSAQKAFDAGTLKIAAYRDEVRNTILTQTVLVSGFGTRSFVQNIPLVRTLGLELTWESEDVFVKGFNMNASLGINDSTTVRNPAFAASEGKAFPRVPRLRSTLTGSYKMNDQFTIAGALRHSGKVYNNLDNSDTNGGVFGGQSTYTVADVKVTYRPTQHTELGLGIENLGNEKYYSFHPMPQRTVFVEGRYSF